MQYAATRSYHDPPRQRADEHNLTDAKHIRLIAAPRTRMVRAIATHRQRDGHPRHASQARCSPDEGVSAAVGEGARGVVHLVQQVPTQAACPERVHDQGVFNTVSLDGECS